MLKCKLLPTNATRAYGGSRKTSIAPLILDLGTTSRKGESFQKWGKTSQYPLKGRLVGPQSWSGRFAKDKNDFPLGEIENTISPPSCPRLVWWLKEETPAFCRVYVWLATAWRAVTWADRCASRPASRPHAAMFSRSVGVLLATGGSSTVRRPSRSCQRPSATGVSRPMVLSHTISKILVN